MHQINSLFLLILIVLFASPLMEANAQSADSPATKTLMWPDGTRYVGGVVNGKRTGKGTIFWQDGTRFVGNFVDDQRNGPGTMILPDGTVYNGVFENDELVNKQATATANTSAAVAQSVVQPIAQSGEQKPKSTSAPRLSRQAEMAAPVSISEDVEKALVEASGVERSPPPVTEVPLYQPVTRMSDNLKSDMQSLVDAWADAWSGQRVQDYLDFYSSKFAVPGNQPRKQWEALRRSRLQRPAFINLSITFSGFEVVAADEVEVTFTQTYKSDRFSDVTDKIIRLGKENERWMILREQSQ